MDLRTLAVLGVSIVAFTPVAWFFLIPSVWRAFGSLLGWYLRRKTEGRRARILEVMNDDIKGWQIRNPEQKESDDEDWEKLSGHAVGSSTNGEKADKNFDGVIGFFHPFW
jgi:alpha-1,2-mannosyltransferase